MQSYARSLKSIEREEGRPLQQYHERAYATTPLQMEYGNNLPGPYRIDIAILNPDDIRRVATAQMQDSDRKYLKPLIGIEFGTEKIGGGKMSGAHPENDAKKLAECAQGYSINVMRNTNFSRRSGGRHYEKSLRIDKFKDSMQARAHVSSSVLWIGMVIHIAFVDIEFLGSGCRWANYDLAQGPSALAEAIRTLFSERQQVI
jgi:hypothetical protein